jgi:hypothetical protein
MGLAFLVQPPDDCESLERARTNSTNPLPDAKPEATRLRLSDHMYICIHFMPLPKTTLPRAVVVLPLLPRTPPPPNAFRFELAKDAFFLKQEVQNFDRVETASFVQRGLLHFLLALAFVFTMAATGKLELKWRYRPGIDLCKTFFALAGEAGRFCNLCSCNSMHGTFVIAATCARFFNVQKTGISISSQLVRN